MLMLGAQLTTIFFKGMLGLPFGIADPNFKIQLPPFALSVAVMCLVLGMIIFLSTFCPLWSAGRYDNRLVVVVLFAFLLRIRSPVSCTGSGSRSAVVVLCRRCLTAVITGLVNIDNTYGAIRGADVFYPQGTGIRVIVVALWRPDL